MTVLAVDNLRVAIGNNNAPVVSEVSFALAAGETLGLVGESGCGKSMLALALMDLLPPEAQIEGGRITLCGVDVSSMTATDRRKTRGKQAAMIFQEPMTSLNPVMRIGDQLTEAILCHEKIGKSAARKRALELLQTVRMSDAALRLNAYPHELSGGMRQRVMIAMALSCRPQVLIADEPTTALDVTVQGQILALLADLRREFNIAMLLITHDLGLLSQVADRVLVMYRGVIVEQAALTDLLATPRHPYTAGLISCTPSLTANCEISPLAVIPGRLPALTEKLNGCAFHPRCSQTAERCRQEVPTLSTLDDKPESTVRCFFPLAVR